VGSATKTRVIAALGTTIAAAVVLGGLWALSWNRGPAATPSADQLALSFPSSKGLNYGIPRAEGGEYVGTQWLRSGPGRDYWSSVRPEIAADLDFIVRHNLGNVVRTFIGLDQAMIWDAQDGFQGFDDRTLAHFEETLDLFDARHVKMIAVLYDQEEVGNVGNFHFAALDGNHSRMRSNYLRATELFLRRFGPRKTIVAWDLFNEAYYNLGRDGDLPPPPAPNPVSPGYSRAVVQAFLQDLYRVAKRSAPKAWFTVSDAELYWNPHPDLSRYDGILDFYDIHIYDDHPKLPDWKRVLRKPVIIGEAGAGIKNNHFRDQRINPEVVRYLLEHAEAVGVTLVLVQAIADDNVFPATRDRLTPTGAVLANFKGIRRDRFP
jgi:hypothetical protein